MAGQQARGGGVAKEHDEWLGGLGIDVGGILQQVRDAELPSAAQVSDGVSALAGGAAGMVRDAASGAVDAVGAAADKAGEDLKGAARDTLLEGVGVVSGVVKQVTEVVDTGMWLGTEYKGVRAKVAGLGGGEGSAGNQVAGQAFDAVANLVTMGGAGALKGLGDAADLAKQAGLVDKPAPGQEARASLTAPLAGVVNDLGKKIETAVGGTPDDPSLFSPLEKAEIASALGTQTALALTGAEEVKVALNVVGALQSVRGIVETMRRNKNWESDPAFWSGVIGIVLSIVGLKHSAGASKFTTLLMRFGWTAQVVPLLLQMHDAYFAEGLSDEEREQKVKAFWTQAVTVLKDAILHVAQSQAEQPQRGAPPPAEEGGPTAGGGKSAAGGVDEPGVGAPAKGEVETAPVTAAGDDEPFVLLGNAPEEAGTVGNSPPNGAPPEGFEPTAHPAAADGTSPQGVPPEGFEPTAHPAAGGGKVRRVRGLQSSGEQSRFSPKAGTMEGLEHTESAGAVRGREVTPEEQRFGIPSAEDWEGVRGATPTSEQRAAAQEALPEGSPDPALPGVTVGKAQADHIVSVDRIRRMPGFAQLDEAAQIKVLNMDENLAPLGEVANQAKGGKAIADFHEAKGIAVDAQWKADMLAREQAVLPKIQERINELLREQMAKPPEPH